MFSTCVCSHGWILNIPLHFYFSIDDNSSFLIGLNHMNHLTDSNSWIYPHDIWHGFGVSTSLCCWFDGARSREGDHFPNNIVTIANGTIPSLSSLSCKMTAIINDEYQQNVVKLSPISSSMGLGLTFHQCCTFILIVLHDLAPIRILHSWLIWLYWMLIKSLHYIFQR